MLNLQKQIDDKFAKRDHFYDYDARNIILVLYGREMGECGDEKFQKARTEYSVYAFSHLLPKVVSNLNRILNEGEDKNVLKAIQIILSNSDLLNSQSSQKLLKARIRKETAEAAKAEAEAEVAKAQVEQLHTVADKTREKMDKLSIEDLRNLAKMAGEDSD